MDTGPKPGPTGIGDNAKERESDRNKDFAHTQWLKSDIEVLERRKNVVGDGGDMNTTVEGDDVGRQPRGGCS